MPNGVAGDEQALVARVHVAVDRDDRRAVATQPPERTPQPHGIYRRLLLRQPEVRFGAPPVAAAPRQRPLEPDEDARVVDLAWRKRNPVRVVEPHLLPRQGESRDGMHG